MDPRTSIIGDRLAGIKRVIAVSGGKGGTGKSSVSAMLALVLSERGCKAGLLDLDFCGPSAHVILGASNLSPEEGHGIIPPKAHGIPLMTIAFYCNGRALPARGIDISNAMIELLAVTRWGELDFLVIDMPPGTGDAMSDLVRLAKKAEFLLVATDSAVVLETVDKTAALLAELGVPVLGTIHNMARKTSRPGARPESSFLGVIRFDEGLESATGNPEKLLKTGFASDLRKIVERANLDPCG